MTVLTEDMRSSNDGHGMVLGGKILGKKKSVEGEFHQRRKEEIIDYTTRFIPLKDWFSPRQNFERWFCTPDHEGKIPWRELMRKMGLRYMPCRNSREVTEIMESAWHTYHKQEKMHCPLNLNLPFPKRQDHSFGYSWLAWRQAAIYAGAREPPYSVTLLLSNSKSALDYHISLLRSWQTSHLAFDLDLGELMKDNYNVMQINGTELQEITLSSAANRLSSLYLAIVIWRKIIECLEDLINQGINYKGRQSFVDINRSESIENKYHLIHAYVHYLHDIQEYNLRREFCENRGKRFTGEIEVPQTRSATDNPIDINDYLSGMIWKKYKLSHSHEHLYQQSYLDFILANSSGFHQFEPRTRDHFGHHLLEYEQALKNEPQTPQGVSRLMQQLIGEIAMTKDIDGAFHLLLHGTGSQGKAGLSAAPPQEVIELLFEFKPFINNAREIFNEPFSKHDKIYQDGHITNTSCSKLWDHWNTTSIRIHGKNINDLFEITNLIETPKAQWNSSVEPIINLTPSEPFCLNDILEQNSLSQSGHSYYHAQHQLDSLRIIHKVASVGLSEDYTGSEQLDITDKKNKPDDTPNIVKTAFQINKKQLKLVERLFSKPDKEAAQGQVRWDDIYKLMRRIGFNIDHVGGSIIRFIPPNNAGIPFNEHRPHPEVSLPAVRYRAFGKR